MVPYFAFIGVCLLVVVINSVLHTLQVQKLRDEIFNLQIENQRLHIIIENLQKVD